MHFCTVCERSRSFSDRLGSFRLFLEAGLGPVGEDTVHTYTPPLTRPARWLLGISGLVLLCVGAPIFLGPIAYQGSMGVQLPVEPTLLSDLRAMAGSLVGFGSLLVVGAIWRRLGSTAAIAGGILYLSYGLSRLVSMAVDGLPSATLIGSAAIELVLGALLAAVAVGRTAR